MSIKSNVDVLELYDDEYPFRLPLRIKNFETEAEYKKFAKNCERNIRSSIEYKSWRNYIVDVLGINKCMITEENLEECNLDVHHHIPSLYLMIKGVLNKMIEKNEEFSTFDVALETIKLHYQNKVGYVCIIPDLHLKFHNGFLNIPIKLVRGNYKQYIQEYSKYLDEEANLREGSEKVAC